MGSRVNYVTIRDGEITLFAQGGGAGYSLDGLFAVGPSAVLRWLDELGDYRRDEWFPDELCEGAVLIDADHHRLLFFSNLNAFPRETRYEYRAAMLDAYPRVWDGWMVSWAYDGVADLVAYIGQDRRMVRSADPARADLYPYGRGEPGDPIACLVSVADDSGCSAYGLSPAAEDPWRLGAGVLEALTPADAITSCRTMPTSGLHLDVARRRAGWWSIEALCGLAEWWPAGWPGWELELWQDDYGRHLASCRNAVTLPATDVPGSLAVLARRVKDEWPTVPGLRALGVDVDLVRRTNFAGINSRLAANVTSQEMAVVVAAILGRT